MKTPSEGVKGSLCCWSLLYPWCLRQCLALSGARWELAEPMVVSLSLGSHSWILLLSTPSLCACVHSLQSYATHCNCGPPQAPPVMVPSQENSLGGVAASSSREIKLTSRKSPKPAGRFFTASTMVKNTHARVKSSGFHPWFGIEVER